MSAGESQQPIDELGRRPVGRLLWEYSLPAVIGVVVISLYNVMDRIFIGRGVGTDAIAGLAITFPVMNLSAAIGLLVGTGASARCSIMLGRGDRRGAELVLGNSVVLILLNATVYLTIFALFIDPILRAFGASDATLPYARDFMTWLMPGMLVMNLMFGLNNIMRATGYPRQAMYTQLIGAGSNLVLGPLFIFGFGLGIKGAAIATDIAMSISLAFVMRHFLDSRSTVHLRRGIYRLRWWIFVAIVGIGAAPSIVNLTASAINVIINRSLAHYGGDIAVGAVGIFSSYTSLLCMTVVGICQGMQPILGYNYGAGLYGRLRSTFRLAVLTALAITSLGAAVGVFMPRWIALAFTSDAGLLEVTSHAMRLALLAFWFVGFQIVSTTLFQSLGMAGKSIFLSLTRQVIFLIPLLLTLPGYFGLDGVWMSFPISDVMATVVTVAMVWWQMRRLDSRLVPCMADGLRKSH